MKCDYLQSDNSLKQNDLWKWWLMMTANMTIVHLERDASVGVLLTETFQSHTPEMQNLNFSFHQVDVFLSHVYQDMAFAFLALVHFHLWHIFHFLLCSDDTPVVKVSLLKIKLHKTSSDVACGPKWIEETYYCTSILSEFCNDVKKPKERLQAMPLKYHTHTFLFVVGWRTFSNIRNHTEVPSLRNCSERGNHIWHLSILGHHCII